MYRGKFVCAIIAAAGMGTRMNMGISKQFLTIHGKPILAHTIEKFVECEYVDHIILIIKHSDIQYIGHILSEYGIKKSHKIAYGGKERQDSIRSGLENVPDETEIILTHDGVRPFVEANRIREVIEAVDETGASVLANPVKDTIKVSANGKVVDYTPNRSILWAIQTPQVFKKDILLKAYQQAYDEGYYGTDDCSLVEKTGKKVKIVESDYYNIKITTKEDLVIAEAIARGKILEEK